jgi:hypothetical protein
MVQLKSPVFCTLVKFFEFNFIRSLPSQASVEADFDPSQNILSSQADLSLTKSMGDTTTSWLVSSVAVVQLRAPDTSLHQNRGR